jgi:hypothetical protein
VEGVHELDPAVESPDAAAGATQRGADRIGPQVDFEGYPEAVAAHLANARDGP